MHYSINKQPYGWELRFTGYITAQVMDSFYLESLKKLSKHRKPSFHVVIDMQNVQCLTTDALKILHNAQKYFHNNGMNRSVVIGKTALQIAEVKNVSIHSGIFMNERYIVCEEAGDSWYSYVMHWILDGKEPPDLPYLRMDRFSRQTMAPVRHIFLRNGRGWTLELKVDDALDLAGLQESLLELSMTASDTVIKHGIVITKTGDCSCDKSCCNSETNCLNPHTQVYA